MKEKKIIKILEHNSGRLANQLWNFAAVYVFAQEKKLTLDNYSFVDYFYYFGYKTNNKFVNTFFYFYKFICFILPKLVRGVTVNKIKVLYRFILNCFISSKDVIYSGMVRGVAHKRIDLKSYKDNNIKTYLVGWFLNSEGLLKHHEKVVDYFRPSEDIMNNIQAKIREIKEKKYKHVVGVHIRQGDYKDWEGGRYYFDHYKVKEILKEYLKEYNLHVNDVYFLMCSDGDIDMSVFEDFNLEVSNSNEVEDLYMLAHTDIIIGSDSTFGAWAAYYGDIPFIVFNKNIDWDYYRGKNNFFFNKYNTVLPH